MSFIETPLFPISPDLGFQSGFNFDVQIVKVASGAERRTRNRIYPLHQYHITGTRANAVIEDLRGFAMAVGGPFVGFRLHDYGDFKSCLVASTPTPNDQPLIFNGTAYQLTKYYVRGAQTQQRRITKPVAGTIRIANTSGVEQASNLWTIDTTTGLLTPLAGFVGTPGYWGGNFDVPVRFDANSFDQLMFDTYVSSVQLQLIELLL